MSEISLCPTLFVFERVTSVVILNIYFIFDILLPVMYSLSIPRIDEWICTNGGMIWKGGGDKMSRTTPHHPLFVHYKSHTICPGIEPDPRGEKLNFNRLSAWSNEMPPALNSALSSFSWTHAGSSARYTATFETSCYLRRLSLPSVLKSHFKCNAPPSLHPHFRMHTIRSALLTVYSESIRNKRQDFVSQCCLLLCIKNGPDEYWLKTLECKSGRGINGNDLNVQQCN